MHKAAESIFEKHEITATSDKNIFGLSGLMFFKKMYNFKTK